MGKIFCIGLNKTGTTSLHKAFGILGLKSVHFKDDRGDNIKPIIRRNYLSGVDILSGIEDYDAYSDWNTDKYNIEIFKEFDRQCPESKFILNTRDLDSWLDSKEKHVKRNQARKKRYPKEDIKWLVVDREAWTNQYNEHHQAVYAYFAKRPEALLTFDVTKGDGWEKLCPFLGLPIPNRPFPKKNVASKKYSFARKLLGRLRLLD